jgi:hypothetical protein
MPAPAIIHAALMRPIVLDSPTGEQAAGFEIVAKNGDQFLVPRDFRSGSPFALLGFVVMAFTRALTVSPRRFS